MLASVPPGGLYGQNTYTLDASSHHASLWYCRLGYYLSRRGGSLKGLNPLPALLRCPVPDDWRGLSGLFVSIVSSMFAPSYISALKDWTDY